MASNWAALRYFREAAPKRAVPSFDMLLRLALEGELPARRAVEPMVRALGSGMRMIAFAVAPREIVVVGEIAGAWDRFGRLAQAELEKHPLYHVPTLRPARDSGTARLRSAVALVLNDETV